MDKAVNNLHYEIKFEICVKDKKNKPFFKGKHCFSFLNKNVFYSWRRFFKICKNLIALAYYYYYYFLSRQILKNTDINRYRYSNFRHFYSTIIAELFRGISLLRNSTLITSHLTNNLIIL